MNLSYPDVRVACDSALLGGTAAFMKALSDLSGAAAADGGADTVTIAWPRAQPQVRAIIRLFSAPGSNAVSDLRIAVGEHDWIAEDVAQLLRSEGLLVLVDPRLGRGTMARLSRRLQVLRDGLDMLGRPREQLSVVFAVLQPRTKSDVLYSTFSIQDLVNWPESSFFDIDMVSGEGLAAALDHLLRCVLGARGRHAGGMTTGCPEPAKRTVATLPVGAAESVVASLRVGNNTMALQSMLDVWRLCPGTMLSELIGGLSYTTRALAPRQRGHRWWVETCLRRSPLDLPSLIDAVFLWDPAVALWTHMDQVIERLWGLRWWNPNPVVTRRLGSAVADLTPYRKAEVQRMIGSALQARGVPIKFERIVSGEMLEFDAVRPGGKPG